MSETSFQILPSPEDEMLKFGYDPNNDDDRKQWELTNPDSQTVDTPTDYSQDGFEFGSPRDN
jgi:hypothetical protein